MDAGAQPQDCILKALPSLLQGDVVHVLQAGKRRSLAEGEMLIEEGRASRSVHVVLHGRLRVSRPYAGTQITIATLGAGDVLGEMGFLEGTSASASVHAEEGGAEVLEIDTDQVEVLLQSVPGLAVRFYRSVGIALSQRVRRLINTIPSLMVEEVAQVRRHPESHTGRTGVATLPASILEPVEAFKNTMAQAEHAIAKKKIGMEVARQIVVPACEAVKNALQASVSRDRGLEPAIGAYMFRETFPIFMASRLGDICYTKPRGYAGDFETINMIYDNAPAGDGRLGAFVDSWMLNTGAPRAVRNRRNSTAGRVRAIMAQVPDSEHIRLTSLAVGPGREFFDVLGEPGAERIQITGIDIDPGSLEFVARKAEAEGVASRLRLVQGNIIRMALGRQPYEAPPQHLVYSLGLMDYLEDAVVVACLNWMFEMLAPGGEAVIGNFDSENPDHAFLDHVLEWVLIHRSPDQLRELFSRSKFGKRPVEVVSDTSGIQLFARCVKD